MARWPKRQDLTAGLAGQQSLAPQAPDAALLRLDDGVDVLHSGLQLPIAVGDNFTDSF